MKSDICILSIPPTASSKSSSNPLQHSGLAAKAAKASARRLAACEAVQALPCHKKHQKKAVTINNDTPINISSQLISESQSLLPPKDSAGIVVSVAQVHEASQLTSGTDFPSNKSEEGNNASESIDAVDVLNDGAAANAASGTPGNINAKEDTF